jgi:acyl-CoA synthetase (AMP-forming)/AMP-acid ligase II
MHGTGLFTAINALACGGSVVLLSSRHYDAAELASTIDDYGVNVAVIVGDPFARPLVRLLAEPTNTFSLRSLRSIMSSGAMWSEEIEQALLRHHPDMMLIDAFSSSEALGMGSSVSTAKDAVRTARFSLGADVRVLDDEGRDVEPGSDTIGRLHLGGRIPLGYYKDEAKTAATFPTIDGRRYSVPGDMARVDTDGTIHLLGRGSQCINTAGEKVFPEEVEEALKTHSAVADACVVGVSDSNYGPARRRGRRVSPGPHRGRGGVDRLRKVAPRRLQSACVPSVSSTPSAAPSTARWTTPDTSARRPSGWELSSAGAARGPERGWLRSS